MREFGLIEEDLTMSVRAWDRLSVFLMASWRLLIANAWLIVFLVPWVALMEAIGWADSQPSAVPAALDVLPEWLGLNLSLFVAYTVVPTAA